MDDKIIVTNKSALLRKYKRSGLKKIQQALTALIRADGKRGIKSRTIYLDDQVAMRKLGGKAVAIAEDPRENKTAIDIVSKKLSPDYLLIFGAVDVVPHQDLRNTMLAPGDDNDESAWGDLPYACENPYSRDPAQFVGPTRVVGRVPDLAGAKEPSHAITVLRAAAVYTRRPPKHYERSFGLSAEVWKGSTRLSLSNIFGNADSLRLSPSAGPKYPRGELGASMHFINCHGAQAWPEFMGQRGRSYPTSLSTQTTLAQIKEGTVAAAECCYGAELYDSVTLSQDVPICQSYLAQGAYGFFGSTTIAYGPASGNGAADLICQYFLLAVLDGASLGRAALVARQQFVQNSAQMDPTDLKTLAQFCLYGDPSIHPVEAPTATGVPKTTTTPKAMRFFRAERRANMKSVGIFLRKTKPTASKPTKSVHAAAPVRSALMNIAGNAGLSRKLAFKAFAVTTPSDGRARKGKAAKAPSRYYVAVGTPQRVTRNKANLGVAVVAKEVSGRIVGYRVYHQR